MAQIKHRSKFQFYDHKHQVSVIQQWCLLEMPLHVTYSDGVLQTVEICVEYRDGVFQTVERSLCVAYSDGVSQTVA